MGTITLTNPVAGTEIQAGLHATNYSTLQTVINGNLDNANVSPTADLDANARVGVRKNSAGSTFERRRINLIEGSGVTLTVADDSANEEVDVTIASSTTSGLLGYGEKTSTTAIAGEAEGSAVTIATASAVVLDGSTSVLIQGAVPAVTSMTSANSITFSVWGAKDGAGATDLGRIGMTVNGSGGPLNAPGGTWSVRINNPASGSWVYSLRAWGGTGTVQGGAGGVGTYRPSLITVARA